MSEQNGENKHNWPSASEEVLICTSDAYGRRRFHFENGGGCQLMSSAIGKDGAAKWIRKHNRVVVLASVLSKWTKATGRKKTGEE